MLRKGRKCICKKCEDCNFFLPWDMTNKEGVRKQVERCAFMVLFDEIPRIRGAVDGCQASANEARNRAMETKDIVKNFGGALAKSFQIVTERVEQLANSKDVVQLKEEN